jgi:uncharacterized protein (TIGR02147 family)
MKSNIYLLDHYKDLIIFLLKNSGIKARSTRKSLAEFVGCQVSYVTSVLNDNGNFNQEQIEACARFFHLNPQETQYLMALHSYNRAGSQSLKEYWSNELEKIRKKESNLKDKVSIKGELLQENENIYYSSWMYGAIHVALSLPGIDTVDALAELLMIPTEHCLRILSKLEDFQLVIKKEGKYQLTESLIHLSKDSPNIVKHHTNWRLRAIQSIETRNPNNLHYSASVTLSKEDFKKVKSILSDSIKNSIDVIKDSKEEGIYSLGIDFYSLS